MATIYELQGAYAQVQQMIVEGAEGLEDTLQSIEGALEDKLESYAMVIRNVESDVDGLKGEEKRLADRRKVMENGIKRMKETMHNVMSSTGETKVKGEKFTFTIQKNPPSLKLVDESIIPKDFLIPVAPSIDKKAIMALIKSGEEVPGAQIQQGESLRIR